jgi:hypothetical protein
MNTRVMTGAAYDDALEHLCLLFTTIPLLALLLAA